MLYLSRSFRALPGSDAQTGYTRPGRSCPGKDLDTFSVSSFYSLIILCDTHRIPCFFPSGKSGAADKRPSPAKESQVEANCKILIERSQPRLMPMERATFIMSQSSGTPRVLPAISASGLAVTRLLTMATVTP